MSAFLIEFVEDGDDDGERAGRIVIGDFAEGFLAPMDFWDAGAYARQWLDGARRFAGGAERSCFVTQAGEPGIDDFVEWWTVHRQGAQAVFHNQHLHFDEIGGAFSYERLYESIPDAASGVSQWAIEAEAIVRFARDHGRQAG
jgi:CdiI N-terminal domain